MNWSGDKIHGVVLVLLLLSSISCCCWDDNPCSSCNKKTAEKSFSHTITVDEQATLHLSGISGSIEIDGSSNSETVEIQGRRIVRANSSSEANDHLSDLEVRVTTGQNDILVQTIQPDDTDGRDYEVEYEVRVPRSWQLDVDNISGDITIDDINDDLVLSLINGSVTIANIEGDVNIDLVNGSINADVTLPHNGCVDIVTENGTIDLTIPMNTSASFSARVVNGSISTSGLDLSDLVTTNTTTSGILGSGQGEISLRTTNGTIIAQSHD